MKHTLIIVVALVLAACATGNADEGSNGLDPTTPGDGTAPADWERGPVFVDETDIQVLESYPMQVRLQVTGDLPTPCHRPVWEVTDDGETITVTLESAVEPGQDCAEVLQPFDIAIPLAELTEGSRRVVLNGDPVGEFQL